MKEGSILKNCIILQVNTLAFQDKLLVECFKRDAIAQNGCTAPKQMLI